MEQAWNDIQHEFLNWLADYPLISEEGERIKADVGEFGLEFGVDDELLEDLGETVADFGQLFIVLGLCLFHPDLATQFLHELYQLFLLLFSLLQ